MTKSSKTSAPARKNKPEVFTIGYEQSTPESVIAELRKAKVELLVDVRAVAASRKPGFSKRVLAAILDENGIGYLHLQKLGTPAEGRNAARSGDFKTLWTIYARHLKSAGAQAEMDELAGLVQSKKRVCILCFERDVNHCHRLKIADLLQERAAVRIRHLVPPAF